MTNPATESLAHQAASFIEQRTTCKPKLGIILGSGLGEIAHLIQQPVIIPYKELAGFPEPSVEGHSGLLHLGHLENLPVVCLQGRFHLYEGKSPNVIPTVIRTLKLIGCDTLLLTCSAGSLQPELVTGSLMIIADHINFQFNNPLVGINDNDFGPRFIALEDAYDVGLREKMRMLSKQLALPVAEGVYVGVLGPSFETPAEIRAFRILGADAVGMSTIPEVIVARHCGLRVAAVAAITNMAAGLSAEKLTHRGTLAGAEAASGYLAKLLLALIRDLAHENSNQLRTTDSRSY